MTIVIVARKRYCTRIIELLESMPGNYIHTISKMYGSNEIAAFVFTGDEHACRDINMFINGEYLSDDVTVLPMVNNQLGIEAQ